MSRPTPPDIDRILAGIREEARARGSRHPVGGLPGVPGAPVAAAPTYGLAPLSPKHAADFLALPLDLFLTEAYRQVLGRDGDAEGMAHYQREMLRGRLTRMEVLGRLAFSAEGRARGPALPGIAAGFACAMAYRVPIAGAAAALAAWLLRAPAHCQDRRALEAGAHAAAGWARR